MEIIRHLAPRKVEKSRGNVLKTDRTPNNRTNHAFGIFWRRVGDDGNRLKAIGANAREQIQRYLGKKVYLEQWIKVKRGWADDGRMLAKVGYSRWG